GRFQTESLPDAAFRPLADWVEFRVPEADVARRPWVQSLRWEFEPFFEVAPKPTPRRPFGAGGPLPKEPPAPPRFRSRAVRWRRGIRRTGRRPPELPLPEEPNVPVEEAVRTALNQGDRLHHARPEAINSAVERCQSLEARFLKALPGQLTETPPDQWAELA